MYNQEFFEIAKQRQQEQAEQAEHARLVALLRRNAPSRPIYRQLALSTGRKFQQIGRLLERLGE